MLADDVGPRIYPGDHADDHDVEEAPGEQRDGDDPREGARPEVRERFLRCLENRLEAGHEVGNDLHDEQDGDERSDWCEERRDIRWTALADAERNKQCEARQQADGRDVLKASAEADATVVDYADGGRQPQTGEQARQRDGL